MRYFWLSFTAAALIFLVNIIGFIDTMTNSAMGCGSGYPLCNGKLIPDFTDYHSVIEYTHRIVVVLASLFLFVVSAISWFRYKSQTIKWLVLFAIVGILGESTLGALTVILPLSPFLLAAHLGIALISFSALANISYVIYHQEKNIRHQGRLPTSFAYISWFVFFFLYLAIYFGGYVSKTGSGGAFRGFPIPTEHFSVVGNAFWVDVIHRLFALVLVILFVILFAYAKKYHLTRPDLYRLSGICLLLIVLQALSGALLIYTHLSLGAVLVHVSIVSLLVATLSIICIQSWIKPD
ncbi:COX15/CtaA family protein [Neobacillus sp. OS1-32]|uniref:COX15/CtaA family protein n=1 Tax=Neobacillus sp. OS1-32 TaxID=3070682 RepID=UPI0027E1F5F1|nr:COX15/CtaA family protein [Neobacillus sp. OS1-32]WML31242.1 COX15/CtaA family protein [Neobacillus sp. OS1-32]